MSNNFSVEELAAALAEACQKYTAEVVEQVSSGIEKIGQEAVSEVKQLSPVYSGMNKKIKSGAYRRNWTYRLEKQKGTIKVTAHNRKWSLTHLLENGHLNRDGTSRARAFPHVAEANENVQKKVDKLLKGL